MSAIEGTSTLVVRPARPSDLAAIHALAALLDTVNLPNDGDLLAALLRTVERSFAEELPPEERVLLFVLTNPATGAVVGTSTVFAQHGTRQCPHVYFEVSDEEGYSITLDRHVRHRALRMGFNYDGPTEIGGLILHPDLRKSPARLGRVLSFARFLFIAARRGWFRDEILAELLPPLEPDGTSRLWEALGRRFTGLSYQEADRLSQANKEFILGLFPRGPVYEAVLPDDARALIGRVGPRTLGVERMLLSIGFSYAGRIDPFDGGPHFSARTDDVSVVRAVVRARVRDAGPRAATPGWGLVARVDDDVRGFRAAGTALRMDGSTVHVPTETLRGLRLEAGQEVWAQPSPASAG